MKKLSALVMLAFLPVIVAFSQVKLQTPSDFFGFEPGSDRNLFTYEQLISYLQTLDKASDRLEMREIGRSPNGKPMYIAFFSSPENISKLDDLKKINRTLALDASLSPQQQAETIKNAKVFVLATLSMHSSEVAPSQAAPLIAFDLCTTSDSEKLNWLNEIVFMMVPNHNPDGMDMIVDYYNSVKGKKYEGATMPGVYHKYVGHDNNRDFVTLTQSDTRAIARIYNTDWLPQVFVEKHQMSSTGTRYFVPLNHDPIAENVDEGIWNWMGVFGAGLMKDMTAAGCAGVSQHYLFDDYWPGSTETCIWKNVIGMLTEAASANIASPIYVEPTELRVGGKGLSEYKKSINMPLPWEGGWWRLSDIVNYEIASTESILKTAYLHRNAILKFRNDICKKMVELGNTKPPYYYILPAKQHDRGELTKLINLLLEHGVNVFKLNNEISHGNIVYRQGDVVVPLAQPYRAFIKEVLEKQKFPVRRYTPGGEIIKPYDITTWSLPLHNGLKSYEITEKIPGIAESLVPITAPVSEALTTNLPSGKYLAFSANANDSYKIAFMAAGAGIPVLRTLKPISGADLSLPVGSFVIETAKLPKEMLAKAGVKPIGTDALPETRSMTIPRIALVESWYHDMDAGWTRFVLDSWSIPFKVIRPADLKTEDLSKFDVIIFPDENKSILMEGKMKVADTYYPVSLEPQYAKGMEKEGLGKLMKFINDGGKIVSWGESVALFEGPQTIEVDKTTKEEFQLPYRDITENLKKDGVYCPGSLISVELRHDTPITWGMPSKTAVFYRGAPAFSTSIPNFDMDRKVIGVIPEENILLSGYCENEEKLANTPVMLWLKKGKGQLVLMGFSPQFRASTHATYKLLFNSILL
jgi:hypothetical protein